MTLPVSTSPASRHSMASRRMARRNLGERSMRAFTVSLKSLVNGIAPLLRLALLVLLPVILCDFDVAALALLRTTAQQNDDAVAVLAEVHAVARTEIERDLEHARADTLRSTSSVR